MRHAASVRVLIASGSIVVGLIGVPGQASAATVRSELSLSTPSSALYSVRIPVFATLRTTAGTAISDAVIGLFVDGAFEGRTRTKGSGEGAFSISRDIPVGTHRIEVVFDGTPKYRSSRASSKLEITQPTLLIRTLPPVAGVVFEYRDTRFTSGPDGVASVDIDTIARPEDRPEVISIPGATGRETKFARWWGNAPNLTASFDIFYDVAVRYTDRLGNTIDPADVTNTTLRSSIGEVIQVANGKPLRVHGVRVVSLAGGLEVKDILYGVDDVTIEGTNVINRAQQRFTPRETADWNIEVLFYETAVRLTDALFGIPVKAPVVLEYPGGRLETHATDGSGQVRFQPLPRGTYKLTPTGVGMTVARPLAVSRDSDVELAVITYLDMGFVVALIASIAIGLLLVGRPGIRRSIVAGPATIRRRVVRRRAGSPGASE